MPTSDLAQSVPTPARVRHRRLAMCTLLPIQILVSMEGPVLNVSLATIQRETHMATDLLTWLVSGFIAAFGSLLLVGGRLADRLGARQTIILGLAIFALSSLGGALSTLPAMVIAARVGEGVGAALVVPGVLGTVRDLYPEPAELRRALAIMTTTTACGGAVGLVVGGIIAGFFSWHGVFWVNIPLGALLIALSLILLPRRTESRVRTPIAAGQAALLVVGIAGVLIALSLVAPAVGGTGAWWPVLGCVVAGLLSLAGLRLVTRRSTRQPLVPVELFSQPRRVNAYLLVALTTGVSQGGFFFLQLFMQQVSGFHPLGAGLAFLPVIAVTTVTAPLSVRLLRYRSEFAILIVGVATQATGLGLVALASSSGSYLSLLGPMMLVSGGSALCTVPLSHRAMSGLREGTSGSAASVLVGAQQLGGAVVLTGMSVDAALTSGAGNPYLQPFLLATAVGAVATALSVAAWLLWGRRSELEQVVAEVVVGVAVADQAATP